MSGFYKAVEEKISKAEREFTFSLDEMIAELSELSQGEIKGVYIDLMGVEDVG